MWVCVSCISRSKKKLPEVLTLRACDACFNPMVECAEMPADFNIGPSNWHKHSEEKDRSSSPTGFAVPENGLYLWLRPITPTKDVKTD